MLMIAVMLMRVGYVLIAGGQLPQDSPFPQTNPASLLLADYMEAPPTERRVDRLDGFSKWLRCIEGVRCSEDAMRSARSLTLASTSHRGQGGECWIRSRRALIAVSRLPADPRLLRCRGSSVRLGGMTHLTWLALSRGLTRPYTWGPEFFVVQFRQILRICFVPMLLTGFALSFGPAGVQAGGFFGLFGALDRMGGIYVLITVRFFAPLVVALVLAGAAGTAICADLGARQVREEISALNVLAVDHIRGLVVPRLFAMVAAGALFFVFAVLAGLLGAVLVLIQYDEPFAPFFANFFANASAVEIVAAFLKTTLFSVVIAIVCCYKGLNSTGGAEGVGRAVNQAVVTAFLAFAFVDFIFTQILLAAFPILSQVRG